MTAQTSNVDIDFGVARPDTNVVLIAEEKEIHVNKEFLSFFSPYFHTLLKSPNFVESSSDRSEIVYDYDLLLKCIQIIYQTGPLPSGEMQVYDVRSLLEAADFFDLHVVRRFCEAELMGVGRTSLRRFNAYLLACHYKMTTAKQVILNSLNPDEFSKWRDCNAISIEK